MPLTSKQVMSLISSPSSDRLKGSVEAAKRFGMTTTGPFGSSYGGPVEQQRFLDDIQQVRSAAPADTRYLHPGQAAGAVAPNSDKPLSAADLAWLERLPRDPAAISWEDARQVAKMAQSIGAVSNPSDARLIRSVWQPLRIHHDRRLAEAELAAAEKPLPKVPSSAGGALAAALQAELPQHTPDEVMTRTEQMLSKLLDQRKADHAGRIAAAKATIATVDADGQRLGQVERTEGE